uniref:WD40 repeat-like superfamily protein n=1 Tax=Ornithogalum saundersiae TaxID=484171 RepID=A0A0A7LU98_9ASPA|nr:WD40 repeat-like superfamily protein [Ornithogalum saundersiae]
MIAAVCWVPKGVAKVVPEEATELTSNGEIEETNEASEEEKDDKEMDNEEMDVDGSEQVDEVAHALAAIKGLRADKGNKNSTELNDIASRLNELMSGYDEEDDVPDCIGAGVGNLYYPSNDMDPYLQDKDEDEEEEIDDMIIKPTDGVIVAACTDEEDEYSYLQVSIYEETEDGEPNMFTHQEKVLSAFPLCTAWLDFKPESEDKGNYIAVGTMEPAIEIWDLDLIKEENPSMILGGRSEKSGKYKSGSHKGSVLGLSWNKEFRNVLASASADKSVKVWDLEKKKCVATAKHHTDKVQAVAWNRHSPSLLLSGSFDRSVVTMDCRNIENPSNRWSIEADVESLAWDPHNEHCFVVSLDNGTVQGFDVRTASSDSTSGSKPTFTLHAHDSAVTSVSYNLAAPNLLATGSLDKMVKLWDLSNNQPSCVASSNIKSGRVFSISFSEDSPFLLAVGGKKGGLRVWDILSEPAIERSFGKYNNQK